MKLTQTHESNKNGYYESVMRNIDIRENTGSDRHYNELPNRSKVNLIPTGLVIASPRWKYSLQLLLSLVVLNSASSTNSGLEQRSSTLKLPQKNIETKTVVSEESENDGEIKVNKRRELNSNSRLNRRVRRRLPKNANMETSRTMLSAKVGVATDVLERRECIVLMINNDNDKDGSINWTEYGRLVYSYITSPEYHQQPEKGQSNCSGLLSRTMSLSSTETILDRITDHSFWNVGCSLCQRYNMNYTNKTNLENSTDIFLSSALPESNYFTSECCPIDPPYDYGKDDVTQGGTIFETDPFFTIYRPGFEAKWTNSTTITSNTSLDVQQDEQIQSPKHYTHDLCSLLRTSIEEGCWYEKQPQIQQPNNSPNIDITNPTESAQVPTSAPGLFVMVTPTMASTTSTPTTLLDGDGDSDDDYTSVSDPNENPNNIKNSTARDDNSNGSETTEIDTIPANVTHTNVIHTHAVVMLRLYVPLIIAAVVVLVVVIGLLRARLERVRRQEWEDNVLDMIEDALQHLESSDNGDEINGGGGGRRRRISGRRNRRRKSQRKRKSSHKKENKNSEPRFEADIEDNKSRISTSNDTFNNNSNNDNNNNKIDNNDTSIHLGMDHNNNENYQNQQQQQQQQRMIIEKNINEHKGNDPMNNIVMESKQHDQNSVKSETSTTSATTSATTLGIMDSPTPPPSS